MGGFTALPPVANLGRQYTGNKESDRGRQGQRSRRKQPLAQL